MSDQFMTWLVCQVCGRTVHRSDDTTGWLNEPHRTQPDVRVVRCPQHWSEWALRNCKAGRTKEMRARAREAAAMPAPPFPVHLEPFPTREKWEE